jgi:hypothetical protein
MIDFDGWSKTLFFADVLVWIAGGKQNDFENVIGRLTKVTL